MIDTQDLEVTEITKKQKYTTTIVDLGINGEGIGKINNMTVFIPNTLIGEEVEFKATKIFKNYAHGKLIKINKFASDRVEPQCPVFPKCGGCTLQHLDYQSQLKWKEDFVLNSLIRIGKLKDVVEDNSLVKPIIGMENPFRYRNKAMIPVSYTPNKSTEVDQEISHFDIGFYENGTHKIVPIDDCLIANEVTKPVIEKLRKFMTDFNILAYSEKSHTGLIRNVLIRTSHKYNEFMICLIINAKRIPYEAELVESFKEIEGIVGISVNINKVRTNLQFGEKSYSLWGETFIRDEIKGISYEISPKSFYQVNPQQTEKLYNKALELADLQENEILIDCYCGIGTITISGASKVKHSFGIEVVDSAVLNAISNAERNNVKNISFYCGTVEAILPNIRSNKHITLDKPGSQEKTSLKKETLDYNADVNMEELEKNPLVVMLDPPKKGLEPSVIDTLLTLAPTKIVYISCNPSTLARDLKALCESDYKVVELQPVDCFPMTSHVESVCLLSKL